MDIRFVSSLTPEDENLIAPALLKAFSALLDELPIAYTLRIETTGSQILQHTHTGPTASTGETPRAASSEVPWHQSTGEGRPHAYTAAPLRR